MPAARLTFLSEATERLTGFRPEELLGQHFGAIIHSSSRDVAEIDWTQALDAPSQELRGRINLQHRDGSAVPAEFIAVASLDEQGHFSGANGSVRDMRERDRLESELRRSEERYRFLVDNSPDIVFAIDPDGRFSFVSESIRRALGRDPADLTGMPYTRRSSTIPRVRSRATCSARCARTPISSSSTGWTSSTPTGTSSRSRSARSASVSTVSSAGSTDRAATSASASDWSATCANRRSATGRSPRHRRTSCSRPTRTGCGPSSRTVRRRCSAGTSRGSSASISRRPSRPSSLPTAVATYEAILRDPTVVRQLRVEFIGEDGWLVPLEISVVGVLGEDGLVAIHGVGRDISERERLQDELRRSEERYRFLIENSPDVVFATDETGRFTFLSAAIERMVGLTADELTGQHFSVVVDESTLPIAAERWQELAADPNAESQAALLLKGRDGRLTPVDVRSRSVTVDGRFAGIQGATRDISEQVRLETELRRQAGELAAGEERAHLARELHDSVTQALFSMTLVSRSVEMLLDRDQDAARAQLGQLRDLQREALAEMRALIFELRPGNLEQDGLVRALKTHSAALQGRIGLPIVVESDLDERLAAADRGDALPHRPGGAAQRRQARRRQAGAARDPAPRRRHPRRHRRRQGLRPGGRARWSSGAGRHARPLRSHRRAGSPARADPGRGTTIEVVVPDDAIAASRRDAPAGDVALPVESSSIRDG